MRILISLALFFFLKCALLILGLFHTNFKIIYSGSVKNTIVNLIGIALNLKISLGRIVILTIMSLPIHEHSISFYLCVSSLISFISVLQFSELCVPFKSRVSYLHGPLVLPKVSPTGLQSQIFRGVIFPVQNPQAGEPNRCLKQLAS